jgi:AcrR family transcriptional regulator
MPACTVAYEECLWLHFGVMPRAAKANDPGGMRDQLMAEAARRFREKGYENTSTRELAQALGLHKASLFHYMPSKEALLLDICMQTLERVQAAVEEAIKGRESSRSRLHRAVVAHVISAVENADVFVTMLREIRSLSPENQRIVMDARAKYESLFRRLIVDAQEDGHVRSDLEPKWLTLAVLIMSDWSVFWQGTADATPRQLADLVWEIYFRGAIQPGDAASGVRGASSNR